MKPEGFTNDDVYVCESRYSAKAKAFKKIKVSERSELSSFRNKCKIVGILITKMKFGILMIHKAMAKIYLYTGVHQHSILVQPAKTQ